MIRKILLISLDNLGDAIFASSLVAPLHKTYPESEIYFFCKEYVSGISSLIPNLTGSFEADPFWDRSPGRKKGALLQFISTLKNARSQHFDLALAASHSWRAFLCAQLCAKNSIRVPDSPSPQRPVLKSLSAMLELIQIRADLRCDLDDSPLMNRKTHLKSLIPSNRPLVALHPFAGDSRRCVAIKEWVSVAQKLQELGFLILWIGTRLELDYLRRETPKNTDHFFIDRMGDTGILDLAAAISLSLVFIGHDSGPLHLANSLGVPTLGIFTPGEPERTFPQGRGIWKIIARPSPEQVTAVEILEKATELIAQRRP